MKELDTHEGQYGNHDSQARSPKSIKCECGCGEEIQKGETVWVDLSNDKYASAECLAKAYGGREVEL